MSGLAAGAADRPFAVVDRIFRVAGLAVVAALVVTGAMLALGRGAWRVPFVIAHLCALIALVPLGVALAATALRDGYVRRGSAAGALRATAEQYPLVVTLVLLACATVAVSLSQFSGGVRWIRAAANLATVAIALTLVVRYLRRGAPGH